ncbi:hypothetical protein RR48_01239 [Papilio machaon]|uniref:Uncharacterized protein n=1 Tax=Papilio machaon TaxID=76193 RepID=A0A0N1II08_PAPMA|nr:hypothetical protein RR48_01239 [Papilio machaon]
MSSHPVNLPYISRCTDTASSVFILSSEGGGNASEDFVLSHFQSLEVAGMGGPASSH